MKYYNFSFGQQYHSFIFFRRCPDYPILCVVPLNQSKEVPFNQSQGVPLDQSQTDPRSQSQGSNNYIDVLNDPSLLYADEDSVKEELTVMDGLYVEREEERRGDWEEREDWEERGDWELYNSDTEGMGHGKRYRREVENELYLSELDKGGRELYCVEVRRTDTEPYLKVGATDRKQFVTDKVFNEVKSADTAVSKRSRPVTINYLGSPSGGDSRPSSTSTLR